MKFKKKSVLLLLFVFAVAIVGVSVKPISKFVQTSAMGNARKTVILDAGHPELA